MLKRRNLTPWSSFCLLFIFFLYLAGHLKSHIIFIMNKGIKSLASIAFLLAFMFPLLCQGGNRKLNSEGVDSQPPTRSTASLGKYVFIDRNLTLHSSYDCKVFDSLYQVHIVDTVHLKKAYFYSYCSHCVALKHYERIRELTSIYYYKVNDKEKNIPRAEVKEFLEEYPDAVFVKKEPVGYQSWLDLKELLNGDAKKFPVLQKGLNTVKEKVIKK